MNTHAHNHKIYTGHRTHQGCIVTVNGADLPLRLDLRFKSPTGFEWGYGGSGPAQLALAILADAIGDNEAELLFQKFKREVIARLDRQQWTLTHKDVLHWYNTKCH